MPQPQPIILARANYLSYRSDLYNVVLMPFRGTDAFVLARNLSKDSALALIEDINAAIDETRKDIEGIQDENEESEM